LGWVPCAAADPAIHLLERHANPGYGFSMLDGFRWALDHGAERLATLDRKTDAVDGHDRAVGFAEVFDLDHADLTPSRAAVPVREKCSDASSLPGRPIDRERHQPGGLIRVWDRIGRVNLPLPSCQMSYLPFF